MNTVYKNVFGETFSLNTGILKQPLQFQICRVLTIDKISRIAKLVEVIEISMSNLFLLILIPVFKVRVKKELGKSFFLNTALYKKITMYH